MSSTNNPSISRQENIGIYFHLGLFLCIFAKKNGKKNRKRKKYGGKHARKVFLMTFSPVFTKKTPKKLIISLLYG